tara:strand:+ start:106 stop:381 length:276 start_codon:yes stop_codon:yes gene_type:complete
MNWSPQKCPGYNNASDSIISPEQWAETEGDGALIEGIDAGRLLIWPSGGIPLEERTKPMSLDARALYALLATYFSHQDYYPGERKDQETEK